MSATAKGSKTFRRYMAALATGSVGESFVRGLKKALNASDRRECGYSVSSTAPKITASELNAILASIANNPPRIEPVQEAKGLKWLRSRKVQRELGERERRIVAEFDHFTLSDMYDAGSNSVAFMIPVYTVHATDGYSFTYYAGSWQSGVPLSVIG
jgi:hypothetical protein